jgi:AraC-like DNA-binding protein
MDIETFYPNNPVLGKHIEYYYFQKTNSDDFYAEYHAFPNTLQALNIHKNIRCDIDSGTVKITGVKESNYLMVLQGRFQLPLHVQLRGRIDKVTIIFKPLGLNHFMNAPFNKVAGQYTQVFTEWMEDDTCSAFLHSFYKEDKSENRAPVLEQYLMNRYQPQPELDILYPSLELLHNFDEQHSIEEVANRSGLNTRTFNRLFLRHIGLTPSAFRKIARFRNSLKNKISSDHPATLTQIGYESNFYDQSYFNKEYKKTTGQTPSKFFNSIDKLADSQLIFRFVK